MTNPKKKLLMCYHSSQYGGIEQQILDIITGLSSEIDIIVLCPEGPLVEAYLKAGAINHINLKPNSELDLGFIYKIFKIIKSEKIDIIHSHELLTGCLATFGAWLAQCPKRIYHVHTSFIEWKHTSSKKWLSKIPNFIGNYITGNFFATDVLALTQVLKDIRTKKERIHESKITVIPNGIDLPHFRFSQPYYAEIRAKYNIPLNCFVIGNISRFTEEKGHALLIEAFDTLNQEIKSDDLYMILAGGGKLLEECKNLVKLKKLEKCIIFTDRFAEEEKIKLLSSFDLYVLPTYAEGFGIALLEGLANPLPCLTSDIPVMKEVGVDAVEYFKTGDKEDLTIKMYDLLHDYNKRDTLKAKALIRSQDFAMEKFINNYRDLYYSKSL